MGAIAEKSSLEKLQEAWEHIPNGAKGIIYNEYTKQNVADMVKNGRTDESKILKLIEDIKCASERIASEINDKNEKIQVL